MMMWIFKQKTKKMVLNHISCTTAHSSKPFIISVIMIALIYLLGIIIITYGFNSIMKQPEHDELRKFYLILNNNMSISLINGFLTGIVAILVFLYQRRINRKDKIKALLIILKVEVASILTTSSEAHSRYDTIILKPDNSKSYDGLVNSGLVGYFSEDFQNQLRNFYSKLGKKVDKCYIAAIPTMQENIANLIVENTIRFRLIYW